MDFDGCGCVLTWKDSDGVGEEQFVRLRGGARGLCLRTLEGVGQSCRTAGRIQSKIVILFVLGTFTIQCDFTTYTS